MDISGKVEQRMGDDLSEGIQQTYRHAVSGGRINIFRSRTTMLGWNVWIAYSAEDRTRQRSERDVL